MAGLLAACALGPTIPTVDPIITARPGAPVIASDTGKIGFAVAGSSAVVYVPGAITQDQSVGLVLFLHGALRTVDAFVEAHQPAANENRVIVLAPFATAGTWDAIHGGRFQNDIAVINQSLEWAFQRWTVDPQKVVISGFSDGGTYALSIGLANGDFFKRVAAYSPGFVIDVETRGMPPILISHGTEDTVLPIDQTSRPIVANLKSLGYEVVFREFTGPHAVYGPALRELLEGIKTPAP